MARARLFLAALPDPAAAAALAQLAERLGREIPGARLVRAERRHLTLLFLGEEPAGAACRELAAAAIEAIPRQVLRLGHLLALGPPAQPVLAIAGHAVPAALSAWRGRLRERLAAACPGIDTREPFLPHVTLARMRAGPAPGLPALAEPIELSVERVCLLRSVPGAARYEVLAERVLPAS